MCESLDGDGGCHHGQSLATSFMGFMGIMSSSVSSSAVTHEVWSVQKARVRLQRAVAIDNERRSRVESHA